MKVEVLSLKEEMKELEEIVKEFRKEIQEISKHTNTEVGTEKTDLNESEPVDLETNDRTKDSVEKVDIKVATRDINIPQKVELVTPKILR